LGNRFRGALTPDREEYAMAVILNSAQYNVSDSEEQDYYNDTKDRINAWPDIKRELREHAQQINTDFMPYSSLLRGLSDSLNEEDILWLDDILKKELRKLFRLDDWVEQVQKAMESIDKEIEMIRNMRISSIIALRTATDVLNREIYAGKGYFNNASSI
jgi:hypothetical protein